MVHQDGAMYTHLPLYALLQCTQAKVLADSGVCIGGVEVSALAAGHAPSGC